MKFLPLLFFVFFAGCTTSGFDVSALDLTPPKFGDVDRVKFPGGSPYGYPVHGVDVSKYQGDINWPLLKSKGVSFAFIKATEGGDHLDESFLEYWKATKKSKIPRGAYHFYYFCTSARRQAQWFIKNVPKDKSALPPVLDVEWNPASKTCKKKPSVKIVRRELKTFLRLLERHYGKRPIIYTAPDFYQDNLKSGFGKYEFWLRSVASHPAKRYGKQRWLFWQYTGTGRIPGVDGNIDINTFNGSKGEFNRWLISATDNKGS